MFTLLLIIALISLYIAWSKSERKALENYKKGFEAGKKETVQAVQQYFDSNEPHDKYTLLSRISGPDTIANVDGQALAPEAALSQQSPIYAATDSQRVDVRVVSASSTEKTQEELTVRNQNVLLFVGSLLLVAAAAAFVSTSVSDITKLLGVWSAVFLFYATGLYVHGYEKLRSAAVAFIGTSLGALPFAGIALYELGGIPGPYSWLLTSLIGLVAYFYVAIKLQSQLVSYLTLAFVVSVAASSSESLGLPLLWTFVVIIGLSLAMNMIALVRSSWVPAVFSKPIKDTGELLTPVVLLVSLAVMPQLRLLDYEVVLGVALAQYIVLWLQTKQYAYNAAVRIVAQIFVAVLAWDITGGGAAFGWSIVLFAVVQQVYVLTRYNSRSTDHKVYEYAWFMLMQFVQFIALAFWSSHEHARLFDVGALTIVGLSSLALALRTRQAVAGLVGLAVSLWMPVVLVKDLIVPALSDVLPHVINASTVSEFEWTVMILSVLYLGLAVSIADAWPRYLTFRSKTLQTFMLVALSLFGLSSLLYALLSSSLFGVAMVTLAGCAAWYASYRTRTVSLSTTGVIALAVAFLYFWQLQDYGWLWLSLALAAFMVAIFFPIYLWLTLRGNSLRGQYTLYTLWSILAFAIVVSFAPLETQFATAIAIIVLAITIAYEGYRSDNNNLLETALYVGNFGILRLINLWLPELNMVFYAHWSALVVVAVALWRKNSRRERLYIATGFVTLSTGLYALSEGSFYQLLFLVEHLALLVAGALLKKEWMLFWGLIASSLAVMYFLRDLAFVSLAFLGLLVIGIVIWQLMKKQR